MRRKLAHHKEKTDQKPRLNQSADLSSLKDKVSFLEHENATLSEHIQQLDNEKISAKVDGKTNSDALMRAIYHCLSKNVALENLESVIKSIVKVMTGKEIVGFPDTSTCRVILREMNILSQMMVSDRLQGSSHNTLKYDGTTKIYLFHCKEHWVEVQLATIEQTFTIGLNKSSSGTAQEIGVKLSFYISKYI